eukprot:Platyproteum_vivax@DN4615_c0_g1_i2.p1
MNKIESIAEASSSGSSSSEGSESPSSVSSASSNVTEIVAQETVGKQPTSEAVAHKDAKSGSVEPAMAKAEETQVKSAVQTTDLNAPHKKEAQDKDAAIFEELEKYDVEKDRVKEATTESSDVHKPEEVVNGDWVKISHNPEMESLIEKKKAVEVVQEKPLEAVKAGADEAHTAEEGVWERFKDTVVSLFSSLGLCVSRPTNTPPNPLGVEAIHF